MSTLSMDAVVSPQGGSDLGHDLYGPIATSIPGSIDPNAFSSPYWSYDQPERSGTHLSAGYGQSGTNPSAGYDQSGTNLSAQYPFPQYEQSVTNLSAGYPPSQYGQSGKIPSARYEQYRPIPSSPFTTNLPPSAQPPVPRIKQGRWSEKEDDEIAFLRGEYLGTSKMWALTAGGMYRAFRTEYSEEDCQTRWDAIKASYPNDRPKSWSQAEDDRLTQLVKAFDKWDNYKWDDTLSGWHHISEQMRPRRAPEICRIRWQQTLRGPASSGAFTEDEVNFLSTDFALQCPIVELTDILEHHFHSIREPLSVRNKQLSIREKIAKIAQRKSDKRLKDAEDALKEFYRGKNKMNYEKAADVLNSKFSDHIYTRGEVEEIWSKMKRRQRRQHSGSE